MIELTDAQLVKYLVRSSESKQLLSPYEKGAFARWRESLLRWPESLFGSPEKVNFAGQEVLACMHQRRALGWRIGN